MTEQGYCERCERAIYILRGMAMPDLCTDCEDRDEEAFANAVDEMRREAHNDTE